MKSVACGACAALLVLLSQSSLAQPQLLGKLSWSLDEPVVARRIQLSPYTYHFTPSPEHRPVKVVGYEREKESSALDGFALFSNSFGQPSIFIYPWGRHYKRVFGMEDLSFKWTAGLLYGYKKPYEDKVPLNVNGFSPGLILALNYRLAPQSSVQVNLLGTAGLMLQYNHEIKPGP